MTRYASRLTELTGNLLRLYRTHSTDSDRHYGSLWYPNAHRIMLEWADTYGVSIATAACVTAAVSPQCPWNRNLIVADDILAGRIPSVYGALRVNVRKAQQIFTDRAGQTLPYFPQGPKVASFACNLAGDLSHVTVDSHAAQAALDDVTATVYLKWPVYAIFVAAYKAAARKVRVEPATFQAILWHTWKRLHPTAVKRQVRQQWHPVGEY